jgi:hypothetical protein
MLKPGRCRAASRVCSTQLKKFNPSSAGSDGAPRRGRRPALAPDSAAGSPAPLALGQGQADCRRGRIALVPTDTSCRWFPSPPAALATSSRPRFYITPPSYTPPGSRRSHTGKKNLIPSGNVLGLEAQKGKRPGVPRCRKHRHRPAASKLGPTRSSNLVFASSGTQKLNATARSRPELRLWAIVDAPSKSP